LMGVVREEIDRDNIEYAELIDRITTERDEARATATRYMEEAEKWKRRFISAINAVEPGCPSGPCRCDEMDCREHWMAATEEDFAQYDEEVACCKTKPVGVAPVIKEDEKGAVAVGFSPPSWPAHFNQGEALEKIDVTLAALLSPLATIAERMVGQDNRATADPIFIVQQRRRVYGMDTDWTGKDIWLYDGEDFAETEDELERFLRENDLGSEEDCLERGDLVKTGYVDTFEFVQPFFSMKAARDYIEPNRRRLTDPRVYVDSAYRNQEWQAVRGVLLEMVERSNA